MEEQLLIWSLFLWSGLFVCLLHMEFGQMYIINHIQQIPSKKNLLKINNKQELGVLEHACL